MKATAETALLDGLPADPVDVELVELAAHVNAGVSRMLELVAGVEERGAWAHPGFKSCAHWLSWRCGLGTGEAREHVRVACALRELPLTREAFSHGRLSYAQVRALTRVARPEREERLLGLADNLTAAQLQRALGVYRRLTREQARDAHETELLKYYWDDDGSLVLRARLPAEDGTLLLRALDAARDQVRRRRREADVGGEPGETAARDDGASQQRTTAAEDGDAGDAPPEAAATEPPYEAGPSFLVTCTSGPDSPYRRDAGVEALMAVAETALAHEGAERTSGERYQVIVHVDHDTLTADTDGRSHADAGPALAPETTRRLACDASLVTLLEADGIPLSVGRKTRSIPPALRRALNARDGGRCQFPGCTNTRFLAGHHIQHWAKGGQTSLDNLLLLCHHHHRLVHEGGFTIDTPDDRPPCFRNRYGLPVETIPRPPPGSLDELVHRNERAGARIDPDARMRGTGEPMDLDYAVFAVFNILR